MVAPRVVPRALPQAGVRAPPEVHRRAGRGGRGRHGVPQEGGQVRDVAGAGAAAVLCPADGLARGEALPADRGGAPPAEPAGLHHHPRRAPAPPRARVGLGAGPLAARGPGAHLPGRRCPKDVPRRPGQQAAQQLGAPLADPALAAAGAPKGDLHSPLRPRACGQGSWRRRRPRGADAPRSPGAGGSAAVVRRGAGAGGPGHSRDAASEGSAGGDLRRGRRGCAEGTGGLEPEAGRFPRGAGAVPSLRLSEPGAARAAAEGCNARPLRRLEWQRGHRRRWISMLVPTPPTIPPAKFICS
mmetsp:Transcript_55970/g.157726  ORF Transcript_55970/g.157726 Transcript_55970/m.157726 type:complete len:299 (+) Transcript_55970:280-1176(+)